MDFDDYLYKLGLELFDVFGANVLYAAQLYLWQRKGYKEMLISKEMGRPVADLYSIPKPSPLDD